MESVIPSPTDRFCKKVTGPGFTAAFAPPTKRLVYPVIPSGDRKPPVPLRPSRINSASNNPSPGAALVPEAAAALAPAAAASACVDVLVDNEVVRSERIPPTSLFDFISSRLGVPKEAAKRRCRKLLDWMAGVCSPSTPTRAMAWETMARFFGIWKDAPDLIIGQAGRFRWPFDFLPTAHNSENINPAIFAMVCCQKILNSLARSCLDVPSIFHSIPCGFIATLYGIVKPNGTSVHYRIPAAMYLDHLFPPMANCERYCPVDFLANWLLPGLCSAGQVACVKIDDSAATPETRDMNLSQRILAHLAATDGACAGDGSTSTGGSANVEPYVGLLVQLIVGVDFQETLTVRGTIYQLQAVIYHGVTKSKAPSLEYWCVGRIGNAWHKVSVLGISEEVANPKQDLISGGEGGTPVVCGLIYERV